MTGLDRPRPGRSTFQRRPSLLLHLTGRPVSSETAEPFVPRNAGQSADQAPAQNSAAIHTGARARNFLNIPSPPQPRAVVRTSGSVQVARLHSEAREGE